MQFLHPGVWIYVSNAIIIAVMTKDHILSKTYIRAWRKHRGMTIAELADAVGISEGSLSRIETAKQGYKQEFLEKAAEVLGCTPAQLIATPPTEADAHADEIPENIKEATRLAREFAEALARLVKPSDDQ